jgi:outer membrane protein assembly factor BamB
MRSTPTRARQHVVLLAAALAVVLAACDWTQIGFDVAGTRSQPIETRITRANVGGLRADWSTGPGVAGLSGSAPATVAHGMAFVAAGPELHAYDADGGDGCTGVPKLCSPRWTAANPDGFAFIPGVAVAGGVAYVSSLGGFVYGFDATGAVNCSGSPVTCLPVWTGSLGDAAFSGPLVTGDRVYVGDRQQRLYAFDATGVSNCAGAPPTCGPLWTALVPGGGFVWTPSIVGGVAYVPAYPGALVAFDAEGIERCDGTPVVCEPLWRAPTGNVIPQGTAAVAGGRVFVSAADGFVYAFDAEGQGCPGSPRTCPYLWRGRAPGANPGRRVPTSPAVAGGTVFAGSSNGNLYAFDAAGATCQPSVARCSAQWIGRTRGALGSPAVANGVVFVPSADGRVYAFSTERDATCFGVRPECPPLWSSAVGAGAVHVSVANGWVYVGSDDGALHGFRLS